MLAYSRLADAASAPGPPQHLSTSTHFAVSRRAIVLLRRRLRFAFDAVPSGQPIHPSSDPRPDASRACSRDVYRPSPTVPLARVTLLYPDSVLDLQATRPTDF
nr:hypothetical protein CFP56_58188 [Quercus suber]